LINHYKDCSNSTDELVGVAQIPKSEGEVQVKIVNDNSERIYRCEKCPEKKIKEYRRARLLLNIQMEEAAKKKDLNSFLMNRYNLYGFLMKRNTKDFILVPDTNFLLELMALARFNAKGTDMVRGHFDK
jgi:hypothetical protein